MNFVHKIDGAGDAAGPAYFALLLWILFASVIAFAGFVMVHEGLWGKVLASDRSKISILIVVVFVAASFYVAFHLYRVGGYLERVHQLLGRRHGVAAGPGDRDDDLVDQYLKEMAGLSPDGTRAGIDKASYIFEIYVDRLRGPIEIGGFCADVLIRLGLIGTIVGFIMMLQTFVTGASPDQDNIQELLISMSKGMGTALYTTFSGLVAATLLNLQHQLLSRHVEAVIAGLIRLTDRGGVLYDKDFDHKINDQEAG